MRIILYTGKGGVGKTSVAAATACKLAKSGEKVMIMSTDQAHSLRDTFEKKILNEPTHIMDGLDAMEIDLVAESERSWGNLKSYLKKMLTAKAEGGIEVEELLVFPGLEELFSLFKILEIYETGNYDVLIVDCAPTGETLSLLKFPEMFGNLFEKILPMKRKTVKIAGPAIEKVTKIPMPKENVFDDIEKLMERLESLQSLMLNKDVLSVRIVTTPEKIVIKEAKRNFTYLHLYNYNVDAIIVNKVYPKEALDGYFHKWIQLQEEGIQEIVESFREIPVFFLELQKKELKNAEFLYEASKLYRDVNPKEVLFKDKIFELIEDKKGNYILELNLAFADKKEMELNQKGIELEISIKNEKRCIMLPDILREKEVSEAKMEHGKLQIRFE